MVTSILYEPLTYIHITLSVALMPNFTARTSITYINSPKPCSSMWLQPNTMKLQPMCSVIQRGRGLEDSRLRKAPNKHDWIFRNCIEMTKTSTLKSKNISRPRRTSLSPNLLKHWARASTSAMLVGTTSYCPKHKKKHGGVTNEQPKDNQTKPTF